MPHAITVGMAFNTKRDSAGPFFLSFLEQTYNCHNRSAGIRYHAGLDRARSYKVGVALLIRVPKNVEQQDYYCGSIRTNRQPQNAQ
jgi:hypothetical protein